MMRKAARAVAATAAVGLVTLLLLEGLVRIAMPQPEPHLWLKPDSRYGHLMRANFHQRVHFTGTDFVMDVRTNSQGFRDEEPARREDSVPTVVFAGDSFTFGHGVNVEERFDTIAEEELREAGRSIRGINIGVNAWGTIQQTRYLLDHLDELQPDVVVLTICENDPQDDEYFLATGVSFDRVTFPGKQVLRAHSHLFRLLQHLYLVSRKASVAPTWEGRRPGRPTAPDEPEATRPPSPSPAATLPPAESWKQTERILSDFMQQWRGKDPHARLLIQGTLAWDPPMHALLSAMTQRIAGAEYVDLYERSRALPEGERRLGYDGHWSRAMHRISGEELARRLAE